MIVYTNLFVNASASIIDRLKAIFQDFDILLSDVRRILLSLPLGIGIVVCHDIRFTAGQTGTARGRSYWR
jgi:hypothetical protein